jgi:hypothetical protein
MTNEEGLQAGRQAVETREVLVSAGVQLAGLLQVVIYKEGLQDSHRKQQTP